MFRLVGVLPRRLDGTGVMVEATFRGRLAFVLDDASEDEFTFACSVTRVDDFSDVFCGDTLLDRRQDLSVSTTLRLVFERVRHNGESVDGLSPILELRVVVFRELLFDQVADGPRHDEVVPNHASSALSRQAPWRCRRQRWVSPR